jgi:hypothetical protein
MYYFDEYNINLSIEQALIQSRYDDGEPPPPETAGESFKRDLPVYLFLIAFGALALLSLPLMLLNLG